MWFSLEIETMIWLLPAVFMLHDFEEIIMFKPWIGYNASRLRQRFPHLASRVLPHLEQLSTSSFAIAVAEEFVLLIVLTVVVVEFELYALWAGILLGFFIHLIMHIIQFAVYRSYIPAIITSIGGSVYCLGALYALHTLDGLDWAAVSRWTVVALVLIIANVVLAHKLAVGFERFLRRGYAQP